MVNEENYNYVPEETQPNKYTSKTAIIIYTIIIIIIAIIIIFAASTNKNCSKDSDCEDNRKCLEEKCTIILNSNENSLSNSENLATIRSIYLNNSECGENCVENYLCNKDQDCPKEQVCIEGICSVVEAPPEN